MKTPLYAGFFLWRDSGAGGGRCDEQGTARPVADVLDRYTRSPAATHSTRQHFGRSALIVAMKRQAPHEHVEAFRERIARQETEPLRDQLAEWGAEHADRLSGLWPDMPNGITDRAADVWEPLIAIADQAGASGQTGPRYAPPCSTTSRSSTTASATKHDSPTRHLLSSRREKLRLKSEP